MLSVARSKVNGLSEFREEVLDDTNFIYKNAAFADLVGRYLEDRQNLKAQKDILGWLDAYQMDDQFDGLYLLDAQGESALSVPNETGPLASAIKQKIPEASRSGQVVFVDFYRDEYDQRVYLALLAPIFNDQQPRSVIGFLVLRSDPGVQLYPFLNERMMDGGTAESFIVRRDGDRFLYLSDIRSAAGSALVLSAPLENPNDLVVKAGLAQNKIVEGVDDRGVAMIGVARAVPDSPWLLVTRMDVADVYAAAHNYFWQTIVVIGSIILYSGLGLLMFLRQRDLQFYRAEVDAAEKLRESEERFRSAFQYSAVGMALVSLEGRWLRVNPTLCAMLGYSEDKFLTKTFQEITHPDDLDADLDHIRQILEGKSESYILEKRYVHEDGRDVWVLLATALVRDGAGTPLYFISQIKDITERKQAEANALKTQYYLEKAQEIGNIGTWEFDLLANKLTWTEQTYKIFGVSKNVQLSYDFFLNCIHPDDVERVNKEWIAALHGKPYDVEHRIIVNGNINWVREKGNVEFNQNGKCVSAIGFTQDVTERRRIEEQLRLLTRELDNKVQLRSRELQRVNQTLLHEKQRAELLADFSAVLIQYSNDYGGLLQKISDGITALIGDGCVIAFASKDQMHLRAEAVSHRDPGIAQTVKGLIADRAYSLKTAKLSTLLMQDKKNYSSEALTYEQAYMMLPRELLPILKKEGLTGIVGIPLLGREQSLGAIFVIRNNAKPAPFTDEEVAYLGSIASPLALSIENVKLFEDVKENREQLRGLSEQIVDMQETQIKNLARELHDSVGQNLTAININLSLLRQMLPEDYSDDIGARLAVTSQIVEETIVRMRNVMSDFLPPMLERYGLSSAISWYVAQFTKRTSVPVQFDGHGLNSVRLSPQAEVGLFRIVQEALNNAAKYARAAQVKIDLTKNDGYMSLAIADDGVGFDPQVVFEKPAHWGLA
ncbi:MAG: PAS domain S-box protein, partial [Anaerolineales bacterium]|nr:PAS domain S-box protein [Anaerolineales bacterium]